VSIIEGDGGGSEAQDDHVFSDCSDRDDVRRS